MKEEEILEGNKLIAEFMGGETHEKCNTFIKSYIGLNEINFENYPENPHDGSCWEFSELKYHSSWDWLMPVCIKCREIAKEYEDYSIEASTYNNIKFHLLTLNLKSIWYKVVEFIIWFNDQNKEV